MILVVGGDATGLGGYAKVAANFNIATREHLAPLGHGGPNGVYALVTSRQMKKYGLEKSDYGQIAIAQRAWAANNPYAVYRTPMTMEEYLAAPLVADPLSRYDCVPVVAGAQAIVVAHPDRCPRGRAPVRVRAHPHELQLRQPGGRRPAHRHHHLRGRAVASAGVGPEDVDVATIYDDYPTMVLAQLDDLGMIPGNDLARFARREIGERRFPAQHLGRDALGRPAGRAGRRPQRHLRGGAATAASRRRASGEGRAARGRHRLRHDHVPLRRPAAAPSWSHGFRTVHSSRLPTRRNPVGTVRPRCGPGCARPDTRLSGRLIGGHLALRGLRAGCFPQPLLCPRCHGATFEPERVYEAVVEEVSVIRHMLGQTDWQPRRIASVRTSDGQRITVGLTRRVRPGHRHRAVRGGHRALRRGEAK